MKHSRAEVRRQFYRAKRRAERMVQQWGAPRSLALKYRRDRKPCSCFFCGNPRNHEGGRGIQDLRDEARVTEES